MEIGLLILQQMIKYFLMMLMGYILVKCRLLKSEDSQILSKVCVYLVCPCVIINAFQVTYSADIIRGLILAFAAAVIINAVVILAGTLLGRICHLSNLEKATVIYSNTGNMVLPIVMSVLGPEWVVYSSAFVSVQLVLVWTHGRSLLTGEAGFRWKKIFLNINIISIVIGILLFLLRIQLPGLIADTMDTVGSMVAPISMFTIGMLMAGVSLRKCFSTLRIYLVTALRLLLLPALILLLILISHAAALLPDGQTILFISFLATLTPPAVTITQLTQISGGDAAYSSELNVVATLFCLLTIPLMTALYWLLI